MKKVIFYLDPEWALGSIHYELVKYFFLNGINAFLMGWSRHYEYTVDEIKELDDDTDYFITTPNGYRGLRATFNIFPTKIVVVAHSMSDLRELLDSTGIAECQLFKEFAVVTPFLRDEAIKMGFLRTPKVCRLGVNTNSYISPLPTELKTIGYAGTFINRKLEQDFAKDPGFIGQPAYYKRSYLAEEVAAISGLEFKVAQRYHRTFMTMPSFYKKIDATIMCSSQEGAGLPIIESSAAGRLVFACPSGMALDLRGTLAVDHVPLQEDLFLDIVPRLISHYKANPDKFRKRCAEVKDYAQCFDWKHRVDDWINLIL